MKKIIALYRRGNTGKTHTLNHLITLLDKSKDVYSVDFAKDRRVSISYGNTKIAITTWGDNRSEIEKNLSVSLVDLINQTQAKDIQAVIDSIINNNH